MLLKERLEKLIHRAGGSKLTTHTWLSVIRRFADFLKENSIRIQKPQQIKIEYIESYIRNRLQKGISKRTLQTEMTVVRKSLEMAGRFRLLESDRMSNEALGITGVNRDKKVVAISDTEYRQILAKAFEKDEGLAVMVQLCRLLGLKTGEVIHCAKSLHTWKSAIERGATHITVVFGTECSKPREVIVINPQQTKEVIYHAIEIANRRRGRLLKKNKNKMWYWESQVRSIGLKGDIAPYSLRYAWAKDAVAYYEAQGYSHEEALAMTAMNLGHRGQLGRYVKNIPSRRKRELHPKKK